MSAQIIDRTETGFTVQITVPYNRSMHDFEETKTQLKTLYEHWEEAVELN